MQCLREVVLDTETTGLRIKDGHRIIEIGCVELINKVKTGKVFHTYINPKRSIDQGAFIVHGISQEFVADKPIFAKIADQFLDFIGDSHLVIHNAIFDMQFINQEMNIIGKKNIPMDRAIDTLPMARKKFPGAQASLDALCKRFNISLQTRDKHGALVDAHLLASVYIEITSNNQGRIDLHDKTIFFNSVKSFYRKRQFSPSQEEVTAHRSMLSAVRNPLWND